MEQRKFFDSNFCPLDRAPNDLVSLLGRSHVFEDQDEITGRLVPLSEVTLRHTDVNSVSNLQVELHFSLVVPQSDARRPTRLIDRRQLDHDRGG